MSNFVKVIFSIVGCTTLALLLYFQFFGVGKYEGAVKIACKNAEQPIARYYNTFGKQPTELWDKQDGKQDGKDLIERSRVESSYQVTY